MPPIKRLSKEDIITSAIEIINEQGIDAVNARSVALKLNCSVQPIFSNFINMDDLLKAAYEQIKTETFEFLLSDVEGNSKPYKSVGKNYIKLAKIKPNIFKLLFTDNSFGSPIDIMTISEEFYNKLEVIVGKETLLNEEDIKEFHTMMWFYTHGIASLIASGNDINIVDAGLYMEKEFIALMEFEKFKKTHDISKLQDIKEFE